MIDFVQDFYHNIILSIQHVNTHNTLRKINIRVKPCQQINTDQISLLLSRFFICSLSSFMAYFRSPFQYQADFLSHKNILEPTPHITQLLFCCLFFFSVVKFSLISTIWLFSYLFLLALVFWKQQFSWENSSALTSVQESKKSPQFFSHCSPQALSCERQACVLMTLKTPLSLRNVIPVTDAEFDFVYFETLRTSQKLYFKTVCMKLCYLQLLYHKNVTVDVTLHCNPADLPAPLQ